MSVAVERPTYQEASRELLRTTVLDAVGELLLDRVWSEVTMAEIAERAGVSRQTLYNSFGSRQALAQAYVMRAADSFIAAIESAIHEGADDPRSALESAFALFLKGAESHPLARAILGTEGGDELLALLTTRGEPLLETATDRIGAAIAATWHGIDPADARLVAETVVRLAISHASLPSAEPERAAADVGRALGPLISELVLTLAESG